MDASKIIDFLFEDKNPKKEEPKVETPAQAAPSKPASQSMHFPDTPTTQPTYTPSYTSVTSSVDCGPHMEAVLKQYEQGFDGLNLPGYDFFEFFKAVSQAGIDNPQVYEMAFTMGKSMEPSLTKEKLISDAQFYINKIIEVHTSFNSDGERKKSEILANKDNEGGNLSNEIESLKAQIENAKIDLANKEAALRQLDVKYTPQITEVDCKITANHNAKDKMVGLIEKVKNNIK